MKKKRKRTDPKRIVALSKRQKMNIEKMEEFFFDEAFHILSRNVGIKYHETINKLTRQFRRKNGTTTETEINYFINHD